MYKTKILKLQFSPNAVLYALFLVLAFFVLYLIPNTAHAGQLSKPPSNLGLVGYWSFNEATGTKATDFSGRGDTGTLTAMSAPATASSGWGSGKFGSGVNFDGTDDYISLASDLAVADDLPWAFSFWINPGTLSSNDYIATSVGGINPFKLSTNTFGDIILFGENGGSATWTNAFPNGSNKWTHVVIVCDGTSSSNLRLYINGIADSGNPKTIAVSAFKITNIGALLALSTYLSGSLDELRVYNRALSASETLALYQAGSAKFNTSQGNPVSKGLIGWWTFDGADLTDKVYDKSGQGNNGYIYNSATTTMKSQGKLGQALNFDGVDDFILPPTGIVPVSNFTISMWIKPRSVSSGTMYYWGPTGDCTPNSNEFDLVSGKLALITGCAGTIAQSTGSITANIWTHVLITITSGNAVTLYINGVQDGTGTRSTNSTGNDQIGAYWSGFARGNYYNGLIDDVRVYNRTLSTQEIKTLYNLGASKLNTSQASPQGSTLGNGLVGYWSFNGADFTDKIYDRGSGGNHGYVWFLASSSIKAQGKSGQGLVFGGNLARVAVSGPTISNTFTISFWANPRSLSDIGAFIEDTTAFIDIGTRVIGSDLFVNYYYSGHHTNTTALPLNEWTHITIVNNAGSITFYRNGVTDGTASAAPGFTVKYFGKGPGSSQFDGKMDEVRIYDRALSATEIKQLYLLGK